MGPQEKDIIQAAYWEGYAAGLADRDAPNPRGWIFFGLVALCLLLWAFLLSIVIWFFDRPAIETVKKGYHYEAQV
jgi:hypothetical protein